MPLPISPRDLIGPMSPLGIPAPYPILACFKGLGFVTHMWFMHLWYAGLILAVVAYAFGGEHHRRWGARLAKQMPVIIAVGVNFGILALLFLQVAYYRAFYPATILMAWPWFSVFFGLTLAYYGVYLYELGIRHGTLTTLRRIIGWAAAAVFLVEGFLFANALSLMTNIGGWPSLWLNTSVAAAPLGTGLNTADPTLWPRWLMMFGLAVLTTSAYIVADTAFFAHDETDDYRRWAGGFALKVATAGVLCFAAFGSWYVFGTWSREVRAVMFGSPHVFLTALTAVSVGLPWLLILLGRRRLTGALAWAVVAAQVGVLTINALSRQIVQNLELAPFINLADEPVRMQWGATIMFLVLLVLGFVVLGWIIAKVVAVNRQAAHLGPEA
ncbi:MAG: hypothetical protein HY321_05430 [Armatimonadetes bacterium]|nr:hypothetical protein [Armatimonadota bacterium]